MTKTIVCRVTTTGQIDALSQLAAEIWNQHYVPIIGQAQVDYMLEKFQSPEAIRGQIEEGHEYYLLWNDAEPVAYMSVVPGPDHLMLSKLYVKADCRCGGLGSRLLELARERARALQVERILLRVNRHNAEAIDWYLARGFRVDREDRQSIGGGFDMDDYILEDRLS